jgi:hypothetical protein
MSNQLREIANRISSPVESRLFAEYGAIFATQATPPTEIIFNGPAEVESFQAGLATRRALVGEYEFELQVEAMDALVDAVAEIGAGGGQISPRAEDAGARSYDDTVGLWLRNVTRGLEHWQGVGRIMPERAESIRRLSPVEQVAVILEMEEVEQLYFGTFFDRSILYSVAAPGASQHLALLAFDVAEYQEQAVELALARHGWFRTVANDLPHFTFLGHDESRLPALGLKKIIRDYGERSYSFWVPDLTLLL